MRVVIISEARPSCKESIGATLQVVRLILLLDHIFKSLTLAAQLAFLDLILLLKVRFFFSHFQKFILDLLHLFFQIENLFLQQIVILVLFSQIVELVVHALELTFELLSLTLIVVKLGLDFFDVFVSEFQIVGHNFIIVFEFLLLQLDYLFLEILDFYLFLFQLAQIALGFTPKLFNPLLVFQLFLEENLKFLVV